MSIRSIIVSDLHVSCGVLDDFDSELESSFTAFLRQFHEPVELIVNGDFLDFVQAPPWAGSALESQTSDKIPLCFTEEQSRSKLVAIKSAHPAMFDALRDLLATSPRNRLVVMPGNHDPDFFWPAVQQDFIAMLSEGSNISGEQIVFHLEASYQVAANSRVWVEHGHQYDTVNAFKIGKDPIWSKDNPPVLAGKDGIKRLYECTGTRFLIKYLNRLDSEYPMVDNIKPFSRFIRIFGASAFVPGYGTLKAALAVWAMLRFLTSTTIKRPSDLLGVDEATAPAPGARTRILFQRASGVRKGAFLKAIDDQGFTLGGQDIEMLLDNAERSQPLLDFLAEHTDIIDLLGPTADETNDLVRAAREVAKNRGAEAVVMGHTHEPVEAYNDFRYFNTGSWTRYLKIAENDKTPSWKLLQSGALESFPYQLLYVDVQPDGPAERRLFREHPGG